MSHQISSATLDALYTALGNEKRRAMLVTLSLRPATVGQLAQEHGLSLPSIHRHIRSLEDAGLILRKKVGRTNCVVMSRAGLREAQGWLRQFHTDWGNDDETLDNYATHLTKYGKPV